MTIPIRLPFNWREPIIYCLVMTGQTIQYLISFTIHVSATSIFLAICQIVRVFCMDLEQQLDKFDQQIDEFNTKQYSLADIRIILRMQLRQHIQFHNDIQRFDVNWIYMIYNALCLTFWWFVLFDKVNRRVCNQLS